MAVVVANLRCPRPNTVLFEAFSHNTIRGAAGGVVFLAELAYNMELL
jgi:aspartate-semialdehyde dehydrogenase